ncbi:hypothetical protein [Paractinoplanes maris]|uniref:hypothetical protein n=1 Tax=Paractinoplanes maris TaxID=1734446 RepID=UPI002021C8C9|nr:hypothetical protein [Actinoplanes maris]
MTDRIDRLALTWRVGPQIGPGGHDRLAGLGDALVEHGLAGGLSAEDDRDRLVCVRRVRVPDLSLPWDRDDAALAEAWGRAAALALSVTLAAGGADVVRYRGPVQARRDLVLSVLRDDRTRLWAWRSLGLWPMPSAGPPIGEVLVPVLRAVAEDDEAYAATALITAVAAAGLLPALIGAVPDRALVELSRAAWRRITGSVPPLASVAAFHRTADGVAVLTRSVLIGAVDRAARDTACPDLDAALAAFAVLEVDPGLARGPAAGSLLAEVAAHLAGPSGRPREVPVEQDRARRDAGAGPQPTDGASPAGQAGRSARPEPGESPARVSPPARSAGIDPVPAAVITPGRVRRTSWGGLLFLLPLVAEVDLPGRVTADPGRYGGPGLRPVLHELGRRTCRRAAPAAGPPEPDDPAVLAFAGLPPDAEPPEPPPHPEILEPVVDELAGILRAMLPPQPTEQALLRLVSHRSAVVEAEPGWIDLLFDLDDVDVDIRRAGLDLDPGFLPWLGCVVRYRYG